MLISNPTINSQQILLLPTCKGIEVININEIIRIEAISNYSKLMFSNERPLVVAKVLRWFEEYLKPLSHGEGSFLRIHRTHLVNKKFIQFYQSGKIKLLTGEYIDVAKRKKSDFLKYWIPAA